MLPEPGSDRWPPLPTLPLKFFTPRASSSSPIHRLAQHLLLRLRPPSDGDVLCPGGTVSILGPSSVRLTSPDDIKPTIEEVDHIINQGVPIVPSLKQSRYIRAFSGVRPLIAKKKTEGSTDDRKISRGFDLIDHSADGC